jgi:hypothetical protein
MVIIFASDLHFQTIEMPLKRGAVIDREPMAKENGTVRGAAGHGRILRQQSIIRFGLAGKFNNIKYLKPLAGLRGGVFCRPCRSRPSGAGYGLIRDDNSGDNPVFLGL